jgi:hypothetical protein
LAEIWRTGDWNGREVAFTTAAQDHILEKHDDMAEFQANVRMAIELPDLVTRDARYGRRENHYRRIPSTGGWVKVVVNYRPVPPQGAWNGEVITAYHVPRPKPKEAKLWP